MNNVNLKLINIHTIVIKNEFKLINIHKIIINNEIFKY